MENQGARFRKEDFPPLLHKILNILKNTPDIQENGFRSYGLCPLQLNNIKYDKFFKTNCSETPSQGTEKRKKAELFHTTIGEWTGAMENRNLFLFWKQIQHDLSEERGELLTDGDISQIPTHVNFPVADNDIKQKDIVTIQDIIQAPIIITVPSEASADANIVFKTRGIEIDIFFCAT
ncbi:hypothetical protein JTB14_034984 [Gonioctena quinquepunctata]|nr:hypothetical protein JTB14_034984 [Gonioctena quinquepunctata]